jgi:hypothetical protein
MVDDRDDVLLAAFQVLLEDGVENDEAFDEFEDTVLRIVRRRLTAPHQTHPSEHSAASAAARPDSPSPPDVASRPLTAASERERGREHELSTRHSSSSLIRDECAFIGILGSEGALDEADAALLDAAVRRNNPVVRAVLDVFRSDGDMHELLVCCTEPRVSLASSCLNLGLKSWFPVIISVARTRCGDASIACV